jgi:hypothetical protein
MLARNLFVYALFASTVEVLKPKGEVLFALGNFT